MRAFFASSHYSATSYGKFTPFSPDIAHLETLGIYGAFMGLRVENAQEPMGKQKQDNGFLTPGRFRLRLHGLTVGIADGNPLSCSPRGLRQ